MNFDPSNDIILPCKFLLRSDSQFCSGFLYDGKEFMNHERELLEKIKRLIREKRYRIRMHTIRHMIEDGFGEENIIEAATGRSKILENYPDELRCLILGSFHFSGKIISPLHIICDYSKEDLVDIVTAYIPQKPWWESPTKRGKGV